MRSQSLAKLIDQSAGKFVTVEFTKNNGEYRKLNGRMGVTKYLKGGKRTTNPEEYITIYDSKNSGYRSINRSSIISVKYEGVEARLAYENSAKQEEFNPDY